MNLREAQQQIRLLTQAGNAVLLEGSSGLGKSAITFAEFERAKANGAAKNETWGLGTVFLSLIHICLLFAQGRASATVGPGSALRAVEAGQGQLIQHEKE